MLLSRRFSKISSTATTVLAFKIFKLPKCDKFQQYFYCNCITKQHFRTVSSIPFQNLAKIEHQQKKYKLKSETATSSADLNKNTPNHRFQNLGEVNGHEKVGNQNDLLEKLIAGLSTDIYQKNRVYKNDFVRVLNKIKELNRSSMKQGLLLLRCCTELLPDEAPATRMALAEQVWTTLKSHTTFTVDHYNMLLRVYIANRRTLVVRTFLKQMEPVQPNNNTYELILHTLAEAGDVNQATEVIANMKAQNIPANESVFNSLIICQGRAGNLQNIQEVLSMMKSLMIERSVNTYTAIARALVWNKQCDQMLEEMSKARNRGIKFGEEHVMEIVMTLALAGNYVDIPKVLRFLPEDILKSPGISPYMQSVTTQLVFLNHPMAALEVYNCLPLPSFGPKDDKSLHGRSLVRDCVKASIPSSVIALITQQLMASGRNPIALQNAAEATLQLGKIPLALDIFARMKQLGMPLRCHYFWPVLLHSSKSYGEKGIMNAITTMNTMEVTPDFETIESYVLPYVSFTSPQNLMKKFVDAGLSVSVVLTPMMRTLLNTGQVRAASELCELFHGKVEADKLLSPLVKGYLISSDTRSTVHILEDMAKKATEQNKDWIGRFLCTFVQHKKVQEDLTDILTLVKELAAFNLKISTSAADFCLSNVPETISQDVLEQFRLALIDVTDEKQVDEGEFFVQQMPHPKHMNEESLKSHLIELEAKGMNTRGVLRKLLQEYCRSGNLAAAREIVNKCQKEGVFLSAGMKAAIFDMHVKLGELDLAEMVLADLNKSSPSFLLDEFKVIDFATLMVYRNRIERAYELISEQSKKRRIVGGRHISMNCWRLLDAVAAQGNPQDTHQMFELLTSLRYCIPTNTMLGPLIRVHLKNQNLSEAVNEFTRIAEKYNKTPLKHELLCTILKTMSDGRSEENFLTNERSNGRLNKLAQIILNIDRKVHGAGDVQLTLIAALAEVGYKKTLRKLFLDPTVKFHPDALLRRCERFADEGKVSALETVAECGKDIRQFDVSELYDMILDVYQREDDSVRALAVWTKMQEEDITPSQKFVRNLCAMCKANHQPIPPELSAMFDSQQKATIQ